MPERTPEPLASRHDGRCFVGHRTVRLGDADRRGRLRLDALLRYTQDVSDDDTSDAGLDAGPGWVVRRTVVDEVRPARLDEGLRFVTFCSGLGRRWAERRLSIEGQWEARYEVATLWICVDRETGRPRSLSDRFVDLYGPAANGRRVGARLSHPKPPEGSRGSVWPLREVDFDVFGHVNNAAYAAVLEEHVVGRVDDVGAGRRWVLEYQAGIEPGDDPTTVEGELGGSRLLWWLRPDGAVAASASVAPLTPDLYPLSSRAGGSVEPSVRAGSPGSGPNSEPR